MRHIGRYRIYGAAAVVVAAALLLKTSEVADGVRAGLLACGSVVIPSLFPFMILAGLIGSTHAGTALSRAAFAASRRVPGLKNLPEQLWSPLLMSLIGGFPVGAQMLSGMVERGEIDSKTASRALCFSVNAGPSFLVSAVGASMLGSRQAGLFLLLAQVMSSLIIAAFLFRPARCGCASLPHSAKRAIPNRTNPPHSGGCAVPNPPHSGGYAVPNPPHSGGCAVPNLPHSGGCAVPNRSDSPPSGHFVSAVRGASAGILGLCAFVVAFSAISALLSALGATDFIASAAAKLVPIPVLGAPFFSALLTGLMEVTGGCAAAAALHTRAGFILCSFLIAFSSLSIMFQIKSYFSPASGVRFSAFYRSRLIHGGITALFSAFLSLLLPPAALAASVSSSAPVPSVAPGMAVTTVCLVCMCTILISSPLKFGKRLKKFSLHGGNSPRNPV